jgi:phospholipid/cholesterol/gamma-HCH transport system permease protein
LPTGRQRLELKRLYHATMPSSPTLKPDLPSWSRSWLGILSSWWFMLQFGAVVLVIALSPGTYNRARRATTARHIYTSTWQVLPWFTALAALLNLVLIRIVVVTALSYGLSQYALQMVVRVLVLELIPLSAALFVALRVGLSFHPNALPNPTSGGARKVADLSLERLRTELAPRVFADALAVLTLAMVSSVVALVLTYLTVYGLSPWGLPGFTRTVGQVFDPTVSLSFMLKAVLFSLAVAVVPMAAHLEAAQQTTSSTVQPGAVRLFVVLLLIEAASLVVKYI